MAGLARTPEEERAFRAMAFSLDPDHDPSLLKSPNAAATDFTGIKDSDRQALQTALRLLRSGKLDEARRYFQRPPMQAAATNYSHIISESDYQEAIRAAGRLTPRLLRKFLTLEITLSASSPTEATDEPLPAESSEQYCFERMQRSSRGSEPKRLDSECRERWFEELTRASSAQPATPSTAHRAESDS